MKLKACNQYVKTFLMSHSISILILTRQVWKVPRKLVRLSVVWCVKMGVCILHTTGCGEHHMHCNYELIGKSGLGWLPMLTISCRLLRMPVS